jgi:hypothetical protein
VCVCTRVFHSTTTSPTSTLDLSKIEAMSSASEVDDHVSEPATKKSKASHLQDLGEGIMDLREGIMEFFGKEPEPVKKHYV